MKPKPILLTLFFFFNLYANPSCKLPPQFTKLLIKSNAKNLLNYTDIQSNYQSLKNLCVYLLSFKEGHLNWRIFLVYNPNRPKGAFWFLPHDNENSAFTTAVYATKYYGGGFLAMANNNRRYNKGQDPNRNFSSANTRICPNQLAPSPIYTNTIFSIINHFKSPNLPYLALHNNTNKGGISALKNSSKTNSYLAYPLKTVQRGVGLSDEDSIIYIAGGQANPPQRKLQALLNAGLNVKYEHVTEQNNDCSMSNYIVLELGSQNYYNIEAQHGKTATQIKMLNRLMQIIY